MTIIGILSAFVWLITSFVIVVDMFKKHTAIGCLGLILLPLCPLIWVFKGYSGNKKKAAIILYGSLTLAVSLNVYQWKTVGNEVEPFIHAASLQGINLSLRQIGVSEGYEYATLVSLQTYEPTNAYTSVNEMLEVIQKEQIESLAVSFPEGLKNRYVIKVALPTTSGFVAVYEIDGPGSISKSYSSTLEDL